MYSKHTGSMRVVQTEERGLDRKVINFFLCVFAKKYMGVVWDTEGGIPTVKVTREGNDHGHGVGTSEARDLSWGSRSPKVRALCLVKAATRPTAGPIGSNESGGLLGG